ncbi:MAG: prepilin-type N-terminal cleavage/methylation domain-containing protein [Candidatus Omnitrophica bacterium]|nr:prepilin-type N-terminal cleavage/methylation domain-containing protein [Candidatus Omnitrophota bacterium]
MVINKFQDNIKSEKAVSLLEVLIVIAIIGIVAGITLFSGYQITVEKQRGLEAVSTLQLIYNAQKRLFLDKGKYFNCSVCSPKEILDGLGVLPKTEYFTYKIQSVTDEEGNWNFTAQAIRRDGICKGKTLTVNEISAEVIKDCSAWK